MFKTTEHFDESLTKRKVYSVRSSITGYIYTDLDFAKGDFDSAVNYALNKGIKESELYQEFDNNLPIDENKEHWNDEYMSLQIVRLTDNFSKKRIAHIKQVAKKVYSNEPSDTKYISDSQKVVDARKKIAKKNKKNMKKKDNTVKLIVGAVAIAAVAGLVIWSLSQNQ